MEYVTNSNMIQHFKIANGFRWISNSTTYQAHIFNSAMWGQNNEISRLFYFARQILILALSDIDSQLTAEVRTIFRRAQERLHIENTGSKSIGNNEEEAETIATEETISPVTQENDDFQDARENI
jgi:hypothetical protein